MNPRANLIRRDPIQGSPGPWDEHVEWYRPQDLDPPHAPERGNDLAVLSQSMLEKGWVGRPLLAVRHAAEWPPTCHTGSHRIAAARDAGLSEVPIVVVNCENETNPERDVLEMIEEHARIQGGDALVSVVRDLWTEDYLKSNQSPALGLPPIC